MKYFNNHLKIYEIIKVFKENNEITEKCYTTDMKIDIRYCGINKNFTIQFTNDNFYINNLDNVNKLCKKYNLESIKPIES